MVMHCLELTNPTPWEAAGGWHEFKDGLGFIVRPCLKNKAEQSKNPNKNPKNKKSPNPKY